jgi:hypothetical protein
MMSWTGRTRCGSCWVTCRAVTRVARVTLAGLSARAAAELAGPAGADAGELHRRTAGNPFLATQVLAAGPGLVPRPVQDAVLGRAARLGTAARDLLDAAPVVPGPAGLWLPDALAQAAGAGALDECGSHWTAVAG